jgi:hypothetical protein
MDKFMDMSKFLAEGSNPPIFLTRKVDAFSAL